MYIAGLFLAASRSQRLSAILQCKIQPAKTKGYERKEKKMKVAESAVDLPQCTPLTRLALGKLVTLKNASN